MKVMIFSGTYEGRRLSEILSREGIAHYVCVATKYGLDAMSPSKYVTVRDGRMDSDMMQSYLASNDFGRDDIVIDATHPYATEVSGNIAESVKKSGCSLIRIVRRSRNYDGRVFSDMEEFAAFIDKEKGNILLTTGTNTLDVYCRTASVETVQRTYVRIIPAKASLDTAVRCGIEPSHIIAMQGPFTYDMNRAVLEQYGIKHMLTKDSGDAGGFYEKCRAAASCNVSVNIIDRPSDEEGVSIYEAYSIITRKDYIPNRQITLAGYGPGGGSSVTVEVLDAIRSADAVFASKRLLCGISAPRKYEMYLAEDIIAVLEADPGIEHAVVLFSGDPGFYSGAKGAFHKFKEWDKTAKVRILSGISSVSYMASKVGVAWEGAHLISIHGRSPVQGDEDLIDSIIHNDRTFALMSADSDVRRIAGMLDKKSIPVRIWVGSNLSYETEQVIPMSVNEAKEYRSDGMITVLFINGAPGDHK